MRYQHEQQPISRHSLRPIGAKTTFQRHALFHYPYLANTPPNQPTVDFLGSSVNRLQSFG